MGKGPYTILPLVFAFLIGMIASFLWVTNGSLIESQEKSSLYLDKLSVLLSSMDQSLSEVRHNQQTLDARLGNLENRLLGKTGQVQIGESEVSGEKEGQEKGGEEEVFDLWLPFIAMSAKHMKPSLGRVGVRVSEGIGRIVIEHSPFLGDDLESHAAIAVDIAAEIARKRKDSFDVTFSFSSEKAGLLQSSSMGSVLALGAYAAFEDLDPIEGTLLLGGILDDGTIRPMGDVFQKIESAGANEISTFLVPKGQERVTVYRTEGGYYTPNIEEGTKATILNVREHAKEKWDMRVKEVGTIYEAIPLILN